MCSAWWRSRRAAESWQAAAAMAPSGESSTIYKSLIGRLLETCFRPLSQHFSASDAAVHRWRQKKLG